MDTEVFVRAIATLLMARLAGLQGAKRRREKRVGQRREDWDVDGDYRNEIAK